jgi:hypothetical protein
MPRSIEVEFLLSLWLKKEEKPSKKKKKRMKKSDV